MPGTVLGLGVPGTHNSPRPHGSKSLVFPWEALRSLFTPPPSQAALPLSPHSHFTHLLLTPTVALTRPSWDRSAPSRRWATLGLQLYLSDGRFPRLALAPERKELPPTPGLAPPPGAQLSSDWLQETSSAIGLLLKGRGRGFGSARRRPNPAEEKPVGPRLAAPGSRAQTVGSAPPSGRAEPEMSASSALPRSGPRWHFPLLLLAVLGVPVSCRIHPVVPRTSLSTSSKARTLRTREGLGVAGGHLIPQFSLPLYPPTRHAPVTVTPVWYPCWLPDPEIFHSIPPTHSFDDQLRVFNCPLLKFIRMSSVLSPTPVCPAHSPNIPQPTSQSPYVVGDTNSHSPTVPSIITLIS